MLNCQYCVPFATFHYLVITYISVAVNLQLLWVIPFVRFFYIFEFVTFELSVPPCYEWLAFCFSSYASERCLIQEESINFHSVKYVWQLSIAYVFVYTALVFLIPASHYPHRKLQDVCLRSLRVLMLQQRPLLNGPVWFVYWPWFVSPKEDRQPV